MNLARGGPHPAPHRRRAQRRRPVIHRCVLTTSTSGCLCVSPRQPAAVADFTRPLIPACRVYVDGFPNAWRLSFRVGAVCSQSATGTRKGPESSCAAEADADHTGNPVDGSAGGRVIKAQMGPAWLRLRPRSGRVPWLRGRGLGCRPLGSLCLGVDASGPAILTPEGAQRPWGPRTPVGNGRRRRPSGLGCLPGLRGTPGAGQTRHRWLPSPSLRLSLPIVPCT